MHARLIFAILSTILEEVALAVIVLLGLPRLGLYIPFPGLIVLMVAWGIVSVLIYRMGSRALGRKPVLGLPEMIGSSGKVVSHLSPEGTVKVKNELWTAKSDGEDIYIGENVTVVAQDGLRLIVCRKEQH